MGAQPELGDGDVARSRIAAAALGESEQRLRAGGGRAAGAASGVSVSRPP